ncbi:DUF2156 domain-containing protein [Filifactor alocis]
MSILDGKENLHHITANSKEELQPYFDKVSYEACEYSFTTMYMWQQSYGFRYYKTDKFLLIFGEYEGDIFVINPLCEMQYLDDAFDEIENIFQQLHRPLEFRAITEEIKEYIEQRYGNYFYYYNIRDNWDYVYEGDKMRTLAGRKLHSKKNHFNSFLKQYEERYEYRLLSQDEFEGCIELEERWARTKENDQNLISERLAISKIFSNIRYFPDIRVGGMYIDGKLEAFSIGDLILPNMALIHVEKANPDIRGLYIAMSVFFLQSEFENAELINREDDLGMEGLRQAKLSYKPYKMVEKYWITKTEQKDAM